MKKSFLIMMIIASLLLILCDSQKESETEFDKFAPLEKSQTSKLLRKAKAEQSESRTDSEKILTQAEINDILNRVAQTEGTAVSDKEVALLETSMGTLVISFYTDVAPEHCKSFKRLVKAGYFDGTRFHRIMDGFVIQGGDILTRDNNPDNDGTGGPGYTLPAEFSGIPHDFGIVSMARSQDPNSAGSQFFICLSREGTAALDGKYTVFAKVIGGLDVIEKIAKVPTQPSRYGEKSVPVEPVFIKRAFMVTR